MRTEKRLVRGPLRAFLGRRFVRIREINEKYKTPHVKMTPAVKFALFCLRFYLLFLVGLLFFKFYTLVAGK